MILKRGRKRIALCSSYQEAAGRGAGIVCSYAVIDSGEWKLPAEGLKLGDRVVALVSHPIAAMDAWRFEPGKTEEEIVDAITSREHLTRTYPPLITRVPVDGEEVITWLPDIVVLEVFQELTRWTYPYHVLVHDLFGMLVAVSNRLNASVIGLWCPVTGFLHILVRRENSCSFVSAQEITTEEAAWSYIKTQQFAVEDSVFYGINTPLDEFVSLVLEISKDFPNLAEPYVGWRERYSGAVLAFSFLAVFLSAVFLVGQAFRLTVTEVRMHSRVDRLRNEKSRLLEEKNKLMLSGGKAGSYIASKSILPQLDALSEVLERTGKTGASSVEVRAGSGYREIRFRYSNPLLAWRDMSLLRRAGLNPKIVVGKKAEYELVISQGGRTPVLWEPQMLRR